MEGVCSAQIQAQNKHTRGLKDRPSSEAGHTHVKGEVLMANGRTSTAILEAARALRPRLLAEREHLEAGRRLSDELAQELARAGFFRIFLPAPMAAWISPLWRRWRCTKR